MRHEQWAFYPAVYRYGDSTSNIVESKNACFVKERKLPILGMVKGIISVIDHALN